MNIDKTLRNRFTESQLIKINEISRTFSKILERLEKANYTYTETSGLYNILKVLGLIYVKNNKIFYGISLPSYYKTEYSQDKLFLFLLSKIDCVSIRNHILKDLDENKL